MKIKINLIIILLLIIVAKPIHSLPTLGNIGKNIVKFDTAWKSLARAETLFYKDNNEPITEKEHETLYKIKLENQFPMSTLHGNYSENELETIQQKIDQKLPGIKVAFIPTTMYELMFMHFVEKNKSTIKKATGGLLYPDKRLPFGLNNSIGFPWPQPPLNFNALNQAPEAKKCHLNFNNYAVNYLKKSNVNPTKATIADYTHILEDNNHDFLIKNSAHFFFRTNKYNIWSHDITKTLSLEYEAQKKNIFLLYRGAVREEKYNGINQSLSFGNSWFAGYLFDYKACAYFYRHRAGSAYLLPINKKEYIHGNLKEMFHIPPLTTIVGLVGEGEFFHARSKVPSLTPKPTGISTPNPTNIPEYLKINTKWPNSTYKQIFSYIQKNKIPINS